MHPGIAAAREVKGREGKSGVFSGVTLEERRVVCVCEGDHE